MPDGGHRDEGAIGRTAWEPRPPLSARARSEVDRRDGVENVIRAMRTRVDRPFTLEEMARIAYLSPFYFNRVFRQLTGAPPRRFQTALRMEAAKRLLLTTDMSVTEVCLEIGYQSLGTFTTQFHQLVGVSPRDLRRLARRTQLPPPEMTRLAAEAACSGQGVDRASRPSVTGTVTGAGDDRLVFVGLFRQPYPQGLPVACTALAGSGTYELGAAPEGRYHVAAAALLASVEARACLLPDDESVLVAASREPVRLGPGRGVAVRTLRLRPLRTTDPPILLALPVDAAHAIAGPVGEMAGAAPA
jgi:AraC family transcriptional regulator